MCDLLRRLRLLSLFALVLVAPSASAQWGWGGYGWGGWNWGWGGLGYGSTVQGSILGGWGYYLNGAGQYNLDTARANAIDVQTFIQWNEYWENVSEAMAARYAARRAALKQRNLALRERRYLQLRDRPTEADVRRGDAINLKLQLLMAPEVAPEVLSKLRIPVSPQLLRSFTYSYAPDGVTLGLGASAAALPWPASLATMSGELRENLTRALDNAYRAGFEGRLGPAELQEVELALDRLREVIAPSDMAARAFLRSVEKDLRALRSPSLMGALAEMRALPAGATLADVLRIMRGRGLRFAPATSEVQAEAYYRLYNILAQVPKILERETAEKLADVMAQHGH